MRDRQRDILFERALGSPGADIVATVTSVNRDRADRPSRRQLGQHRQSGVCARLTRNRHGWSRARASRSGSWSRVGPWAGPWGRCPTWHRAGHLRRTGLQIDHYLDRPPECRFSGGRETAEILAKVDGERGRAVDALDA